MMEARGGQEEKDNGGDFYVGGEMTHAGLEEVVLDGPLHQVVADGRLGYSLVVLDGFVIVGFRGGEVGDFEVEFVCEPVESSRSASIDSKKSETPPPSLPHPSLPRYFPPDHKPARLQRPNHLPNLARKEKEKSSTYASALSFSNQPAAVSYASMARFSSPISTSYTSARFC